MENNTFKNVAFGGFDKQDVIYYIEKTAKEAASIQDKLQQENDGLQAEVKSLQARLQDLQTEGKALKTVREQLETSLEQERAARQALAALQPDAERLAAEVERLRPDAEAYSQFRDGIGAIECEARKRAADLEAQTMAKLEQIVNRFQAQYQDLMAAFDATSVHVTGELRKVEVTLSQLPRAMDQAGVEASELAVLLDNLKNN